MRRRFWFSLIRMIYPKVDNKTIKKTNVKTPGNGENCFTNSSNTALF